MNAEIAHLRQEYASSSLTESDMAPDPMQQFRIWWQQAIESELTEPNAMTLATASCDGLPSARIVLLKDIHDDGFIFFTNYQSYKGMQLEENPKACLVFFWKELERQVRVVGLVTKIDAAESDAYFKARPEGSRIGAITSPQSQVIESREWLEQEYQRVAETADNKTRPDYWGGYLVRPVIIEFWQGRPSRLHDRIQYTLNGSGEWTLERLAP